MKVTPDIIRYEFIGTEGVVTQSQHQDYVGLKGQVIGETKNTFTFQSEGKAKRIIKESAIFNFKFNDGTIVEVDGNLLVGRPEDRLKKTLKRLW
ncbi:MAG: ribonuclease P protein component 1 [Candidatus Bathyarchaeota archaeon]|nr:ribonuclease P protein component 1 [Candidatus Bathyarchaeota archaeon]